MTIMETEPKDYSTVAAGVGIGLGLNIALSILLLVIGMGWAENGRGLRSSTSVVFLYALFGIGLTQLLYMVPLYFNAKKAGQNNKAKGLVIAASITALLNATCWGLMARANF